MEPRFVREGKSKRIYVKNGELVLEFKDEVTAGDGARRDPVPGKGVVNAAISAHFFRVLEEAGIRTHFRGYDGCRRLFVERLEMIPLEVIVRNYAYGSLLRRMPLLRRMQRLDPPIFELHYKDDSLHDPLVTEDDVLRAGLLTAEELSLIRRLALRVNEVLSEHLSAHGLALVDMKLEFGRGAGGEIVLGDEITGDTMRILDESGRHLDKEVYRRGGTPQQLLEAYLELARRLGVEVGRGELCC